MTPHGSTKRRTRSHRSGHRAPARTWFVLVGCTFALLAPTWVHGRAAWTSTREPYPLVADDVTVQTHPLGCGAALLSTLLTRRGTPVDQAVLLAEAPPGPSGISLATLAHLAERRGLRGAWRRASPGVVPTARFIAHLDRPDGHFVWVEAIHGDYLIVVDPARGQALWHREAFLTRFSGRYLRFDGDVARGGPTSSATVPRVRG